MSKIIVRKQEYANNGTHADEIKAVVRDDLITQTLTSDTDLVPSSNAVKDALTTIGSGSVEFKHFYNITIGSTSDSSVCGFTLKTVTTNRYVFIGVCIGGSQVGKVVSGLSTDNQATWSWHSYNFGV